MKVEQSILSFITDKIEWIRKHRQKFLTRPTPPEINFISGENHSLFGRTYVLQVTEHLKSRAVVNHHENMIEMHIPHGSTKIQRQEHLNRWYRDQLKLVLSPLFQKWSHVLGVEANEWIIKRMKTRWGSCNTQTKRITISLALAKHSHQCIEFVVCHELAHILEPSHNQRFKSIMSAAIPDWKLRTAELKRT